MNSDVDWKLNCQVKMTVIKGTKSSWRPVMSAVPQGLILSPKLPGVWRENTFSKFAYNTKLWGLTNSPRLCCHLEGSEQTGEMGWEKPNEVQQREMQSSPPGRRIIQWTSTSWKLPGWRAVLQKRTCGVLVDVKLSMNQLCAPVGVCFPVQERPGHNGVGPAKGHKNDSQIGVSVILGEAERSHSV